MTKYKTYTDDKIPEDTARNSKVNKNYARDFRIDEKFVSNFFFNFKIARYLPNQCGLINWGRNVW